MVGVELSRKDSILKGVLSQVLRISTAVEGEVDMPETARTLELLMERALRASSGVRQVVAETHGNLLAKIATPTPVPQATRPRVSVAAGVVKDSETWRPTSAAMV